MFIVEAIGWVVTGAIIIAVIALLYMLPVYFLWNWLMPNLLGIGRITLLESLGLLLLTGLLFRRSGRCKED